MPFQINQRVVYFGPAGMNLTAVVMRPEDSVEPGRMSIVFDRGYPVEMSVPVENVHPMDPPPQGLRERYHREGYYLASVDVARHLAGWRYVVSQEGDDLCWRDFYEVAAALLPEKDAALAKLKSIPPRPVMLHNCRRFVDSLLSGKTECYKADSPEEVLAAVQAELDRIKGVFLANPGDRLYHAADDTWLRMGEDGKLANAEAPEYVKKLEERVKELERQANSWGVLDL